MKYAFIFNAAAGHGRAGRRRRLLEQALQASGLHYGLLPTDGAGHAAVLAREAAEVYDVVVAAGGDGTVQEVSRGIIASGRPVHLGVIPMGTGNDFVKMIGMPRSVPAAVQALAAAQPKAVDYGLVRWWEDGAPAERLFINAVGIGFDAQVARAVVSLKVLPGLTGYLVAVLRTLRRWRGAQVAVSISTPAGEAPLYRGPLFLVTVGNGISSGGGFLLTPEASVADGLLDVCLIEDLPVRRVLQLLPSALRGRHGRAPEVRLRRADALHLRTQVPLPMHADGEMLTERLRQAAVRVVPRGLSVLAPSLR